MESDRDMVSKVKENLGNWMTEAKQMDATIKAMQPQKDTSNKTNGDNSPVKKTNNSEPSNNTTNNKPSNTTNDKDKTE